ncbi:unnamed protein product [Diatraea saccharalis]|uniref:Uncharacterized protein n=1 Tax=Diatraea saccharalis TaxID=40085 RepID=A0A9N9QZP1_9NEOP|nr:unnamed protein product [Diatraea saccharalis]
MGSIFPQTTLYKQTNKIRNFIALKITWLILVCIIHIQPYSFAGNNIILQFVEMYCVWGNLPLMTAVSYILFTNLVHTLKIATILYYGEMIRSVIHEGDEEMRGAADSEEGKVIVQRSMHFLLKLFKGIRYILIIIIISPINAPTAGAQAFLMGGL